MAFDNGGPPRPQGCSPFAFWLLLLIALTILMGVCAFVTKARAGDTKPGTVAGFALADLPADGHDRLQLANMGLPKRRQRLTAAITRVQAHPQDQGQSCGEKSAVLSRLSKTFQETQAWEGNVSADLYSLMTTSEAGGWTFLTCSRSSGRCCIRLGGDKAVWTADEV